MTLFSDMKLVWRKAAEFHLKGDEPSVAAKSLEELLKSDPKDKTTLAQLVLAYAKFDLGKAMEMSKRLPDFAGKVVDVDSLETAATLSKYGKKTVGLSSPKTQSPEQQKEAAELSKVPYHNLFVFLICHCFAKMLSKNHWKSKAVFLQRQIWIVNYYARS